jgi:hypothetical protein
MSGKVKEVNREEFLIFIEEHILKDSWEKLWGIIYAHREAHPIVKGALLEQLLSSDQSPLEHINATLDMYNEVSTLHITPDKIEYFICEETKTCSYRPKGSNGESLKRSERMYV